MGHVELTEELSGVGEVYRKDGDLIGQAGYDLQVFQEHRDARTSSDPTGTVPGLKRLEGRVTGLDNFALLDKGARLTLHLSDGRCLDFQVGDLNGRVIPNSGFYEQP
jgi:hypothetical protein